MTELLYFSEGCYLREFDAKVLGMMEKEEFAKIYTLV